MNDANERMRIKHQQLFRLPFCSKATVDDESVIKISHTSGMHIVRVSGTEWKMKRGKKAWIKILWYAVSELLGGWGVRPPLDVFNWTYLFMLGVR